MSNYSPSSTIINHSWPKIHLGLLQCTGLGYFRAQTPCKKPMVSWFPHEKTLGFPTARRFLLEATLPKKTDLYLKNEMPKGSQSHMVRQNPRWGLEGSLIPSKKKTCGELPPLKHQPATILHPHSKPQYWKPQYWKFHRKSHWKSHAYRCHRKVPWFQSPQWPSHPPPRCHAQNHQLCPAEVLQSHHAAAQENHRHVASDVALSTENNGPQEGAEKIWGFSPVSPAKMLIFMGNLSVLTIKHRDIQPMENGYGSVWEWDEPHFFPSGETYIYIII